MIDFDNGRRRFATTFGMVGVGLVLAGANSQTKTMKRKLARSKT
jgi:hypothetical protein